MSALLITTDFLLDRFDGLNVPFRPGGIFGQTQFFEADLPESELEQLCAGLNLVREEDWFGGELLKDQTGRHFAIIMRSP